MLLALLFLPALAAAAVLAVRWTRPRRVHLLAETAVPEPAVSGPLDPVATLDALLAQLEGATLRIDGADELDERSVAVLERLAEQLEAAAGALERVA